VGFVRRDAAGNGSPRRADDTGASAVEFALVVPLLIMLVFGIIQFGMTFAQILSLNNASRQAARVGVVGLNNCGTLMAQIQQATTGTIGLKFPLTVTVTRGGAAVCTATVTPTTVSYSPGVGSATTVACPTGNSTQSLSVATTSSGTFAIPPFIFISNYQVKGNGVYQCELS